MGRPKKINSPEEMDRLVNEYVANQDALDKPKTLTGLILHLGLSSRQSLDEYKNYTGFSDSVKRAKAVIENAYEERLHGTAATGAIFALKNMGWSDKQELDHSSSDGSMKAVDRVTVEVVGDSEVGTEDKGD